VVGGPFTGVAGIGRDWHGNEVVGNSTVVVGAGFTTVDVDDPGAAVGDTSTVDGVLLDPVDFPPPHAASNNAAAQPMTGENRIESY